MVAWVLTMNSLESFTLEYVPLYLAPTDRADVRLRGLVLSSLLSLVFASAARVNVWRTSWPVDFPQLNFFSITFFKQA